MSHPDLMMKKGFLGKSEVYNFFIIISAAHVCTGVNVRMYRAQSLNLSLGALVLPDVNF